MVILAASRTGLAKKSRRLVDNGENVESNMSFDNYSLGCTNDGSVFPPATPISGAGYERQYMLGCIGDRGQLEGI